MKTKILFISIMVSILMSLTACKSGNSNVKETIKPTSSVAETIAPKKEVTGAPKPEITPTPTAAAKPVLNLKECEISGQKNYLSLMKLVKVEGLTVIDIGFTRQGDLIILYIDKSYINVCIKSLSLQTGELTDISQVKIDNPYLRAPLLHIIHTDPLIIRNETCGMLYSLDTNGQIITKIDMTKSNYSECLAGSKGIYMLKSNSDIDLLKYNEKESNIVYNHKKSKMIFLTGLVGLTENDTHILINGASVDTVEGGTFVYDLNSQKLVNKIGKEILYGESKDYTYAYSSEYGDKGTIITINRRERENFNKVCRMQYIRKPEAAFFYDSVKVIDDTVYMVAQAEDKMGFTATDLVSGKTFGQAEFKFGQYSKKKDESVFFTPLTQSQVSPGNQYIAFCVMNDETTLDLVLWDIKGSSVSKELFKKKNITDKHTYEIPAIIDYGKLSVKAKKIEDKYDVTVVMGKNVPKDMCSTKIERITDKKKIESALDVMEDTLSQYPKGFFTDLYKDGNISQVYFYLTGDMMGYSPDDIGAKGGFCGTNGPAQIITIDITYPLGLGDTLNHEVGHSIYNRLTCKWIDDKAVFDDNEWKKFNPKGFKYTENYKPESYVDDSYTATRAIVYGKNTKIYFDSCHSKTFITEDFATIFAAAMTEDNITTKSKYIKVKLKYMSDTIRKVWDTKNWPATTTWEKAIL